MGFFYGRYCDKNRAKSRPSGRIKSRDGAALISIVLCLALVSTGCRDDRPDGADAVLNAFRNSCVSRGPWTDAALAQNNALIQALRTIQDTRPCQGLAPLLTGLSQSAEQALAALNDVRILNVRKEEEQLQELMLALSAVEAGNVGAAERLATAITETQVSLAEARAMARTSVSDRYSQATRSYATALQQILTQVDPQSGTLAQCLRQSPAAAVQMGTSLLAMGGSFVAPVLGAAASAIGGLINIGIEFARNAGEAQGILSLYRAQLPQALACGLESMTELYCGADDAFTLLELQAQSYQEDSVRVSPLWRALDLMGRRLPVLNRWLLSVKNGVLPADPYEAERQIEVWRRLQSLDNTALSIEAAFNMARRQYDAAAGDMSQQREVLKNLMISVSSDLAGVNSTGNMWDTPYTVISRARPLFACYLSLGMNARCPPFNQLTVLEGYIVGSPDAENPEDRRPSLIPEQFGTLLTNWRAINARANDLARLVFTQNVTADPQAILAAAFEPDVGNVSPYQVLQMLQEHLAVVSTSGNPQIPELLADTNSLLTRVLEILNQQTPREQVATSVAELFELFRLRRGLVYFNDRMVNLLRWDAQRLLRAGEYPRDVSDILLAAGGDIRDRLNASGVSSLDLVSLDLSFARQLSARNIESFRDYFMPVIPAVIRDLKSASLASGESLTGPNRPNGQLLGHLCTMILATGERWPNEDTRRLCQGSGLSSVFPDSAGQISLDFNRLERALVGKPARVRLCTFHRFLRASRIAGNRRAIPPMAAPVFGPRL